MNVRLLTSLALAVSPMVPLAASAQATERSIERWAESIAAAAERLAAQVERQATSLAQRIEREFNDKQMWERRNRTRSHDGDWGDGDRDLRFLSIARDASSTGVHRLRVR